MVLLRAYIDLEKERGNNTMALINFEEHRFEHLWSRFERLEQNEFLLEKKLHKEIGRLMFFFCSNELNKAENIILELEELLKKENKL